MIRLAKWLKDNKISQRTFGEMVGLTQGRVSQICLNGTNSLRMAKKISEATDGALTIEDCFTPEAAE
jgi:predicted XRE-type DNA-binding protein